MQMTLKRKRPDGSPMFAPPHRGLTAEPRALRRRSGRAGDRRDAGPGGGRRRARPGRLRAAALGDRHGRRRRARQRRCGTSARTTSPTCSRSATGRHRRGLRRRAHRVVTRRYVITRVHAQFMEPRGALGVWDPHEERYTLYADVQYPHRVRNALATNIFKIPEHQIRVIAGDVGGGFGTKGWQYPEHKLVLWAARKLGRPVQVGVRAPRGDSRRRARARQRHRGRAGARRATAASWRCACARWPTSAPTSRRIAICSRRSATSSTLVGVYTFPAAHVQVLSVLTNTNSTAPYRGAGRPEATYVLERLIDDAARELGLDRVELRRSNLIPPSAMPYKNAARRDVRLRRLRARTWRTRSSWPTSPASRRAARPHGPAGKLRGLGRRQRDRAGGGRPARVRRDPLLAERARHRAHGQQEPGPGPRDDVQADPARAPRPRPHGRAATSTATPTGWPSAWARWARARR